MQIYDKKLFLSNSLGFKINAKIIFLPMMLFFILILFMNIGARTEIENFFETYSLFENDKEENQFITESQLYISDFSLKNGALLTNFDTREKDKIILLQQMALDSEKAKRNRDLIILSGFFFMTLAIFYYLSKRLSTAYQNKLDAAQPKIIGIRNYKNSILKFIEPVQKPSVSFTAREKEIIFLVEKGKTNHEIAKELYVSENTVKTHLKNIFSKTEAHNRTDLLFKIKTY